jgi:beta-lactamase class A
MFRRPRFIVTALLATLTLTLTLALPTPAVAQSRPAARHAPSAPSRSDPALQRELEALVKGFPGDVGIYVRHLRTGRTAAVNADSLFPTASMIKVPILLATFQAVADGRLPYDSVLTYTDSLRYEGEDILGSFKSGEPMRPSRLVMLMLTMSDNTASLWLQRLAGTGTAINDWLESHGAHATRVNSRTPGREDARRQYGWGQTTPREMAGLLAMIREGRAVSRGASEEMYRALTRSYWTGEALSQVPPWVQAASKQGAVDRSRSEVMLVNAPSGDYVFCVITKNQTDTTYAAANPGYVLLRNVSALLWRRFEPLHPWTPDTAAVRFKPTEE